jgi:hypothetical protein
MSYAPLIVIFTLLVTGAAITLTILFRADRAGLFRNLKAGAFVIFDDEEPVGEPQDQLFDPDAPDASPPDAGPSGNGVPAASAPST